MAKKEEQTSKVVPIFSVRDGKNPVVQNNAISLRAPVALTLTKDAKVPVDLGLSCNYPLFLYETPGLQQRGVRFLDGLAAGVDADRPITVVLENKSGVDQIIEVGDTIARAVPQAVGEFQVSRG